MDDNDFLQFCDPRSKDVKTVHLVVLGHYNACQWKEWMLYQDAGLK